MDGRYAWMVFPDSDYYIIAIKDGYTLYDSRSEGRNVPARLGEDSYIENGIIHVRSSIIKYDLQMQQENEEASDHVPIGQNRVKDTTYF
jgi:hypothetical protein